MLALVLAAATMLQTALLSNPVYAFAQESGLRYAATDSGANDLDNAGGQGLPGNGGEQDVLDSGVEQPDEETLDSGEPLDSGMLRALPPGPFIYFTNVEATSNQKKPGSEDEYEPLDSGMARDGIFRVEYRFQLPPSGSPGESRPVDPGTPYTFTLPYGLKVEKNFTINVADVQNGKSLATVRVPSSPQNPNQGSITFTDYGAAWDAVGGFAMTLQMDGSKIGNTGSEDFNFTVGASGTISITIPFEKATPEVKMNPQKSIVAVDNADRTVEWKVELGPTAVYKPPAAGVACEIPLKNVVVTDKFAAPNGGAPGQILVPGTVKLYQGATEQGAVTVTDITESSLVTGFTATLPELTTDKPYTLRYKTKFELSSSNIFNPATGELTLKNDVLVDYEHQEFGDNGAWNPGTQESTTASKNETLTFIEKTGNHTREAKKGYITWTVTTNQNQVEVINPKITDTLPKELTLRTGSVFLYENGEGVKKQQLTLGNGTDPYTYTLTTNANGTHTLNYKIGASTKEMWKLVYVTDVDEAVYEGVSTYSAKNKAVFTGDGGINFSKTATVPVVKAGHMLNKTSSYSPANHIITWSITINDVKAAMQGNTVLTDPLPAGVTYLPGTLRVTGAQPTTKNEPDGNTSGGTLELDWDFPTETTETITVRFQTRVDNVADWAKNSNTTTGYTNTAELAVESLGQTYTATDTPIIESKLLEKKSLGYVQNGPDGTPVREITWQLDVNSNEMPMRNVILTDTIHEDLEFIRAYFVDGAGAEIATPAGAVLPQAPLLRNGDGTQSAVIQIPGEFTSYMHIKVVTRVRPGLEDKFHSNPSAVWTVTNAAKMLGEAKHTDTEWLGIPELSVGPVEQKITSSVVKKYGEYNPNTHGYDVVKWSVDINRNSAQLGKVVLVDNMDPDGDAPYLYLNTASVKLYQIQVSGDGADRGQDTTVGLADPSEYTLLYDETTTPHQFTLTIHNVSRAYRLEYLTDIAGVPDGTVMFKNSMKLSGTSTGDASEDESSLSASFGSGSGAGSLPGYAEFRVEKQDENGLPLAGAEFELRGKTTGTPVYRLVTDDTGTATLNQVRATQAGTPYVLTETKAPSGYALPQDTTWEVLLKKNGSADETAKVVKDPQILGTLTAVKQDINGGAPLSGAQFTLTKQGDAAFRIQKETDGAGKAEFTGLTIGSYTVEETRAPQGYSISPNQIHSFTVADDQTAAAPAFTKVFENEKIPGTLTIHKKDAVDGTALSGAEFTLYEGNQALEKAASGEDGRAVFLAKLLDGHSYSVRETKPPVGYLLNTTPQSVSIQTPEQSIDLTFFNQKIYGSIQLTKKDAQTGDIISRGAMFRLTKDGDASFPAREQSISGGRTEFARLSTGSYTVREIEAPEGYVLDETPMRFTILEEAQGGALVQTLTRDVLNSKIPGSLTVWKVDSEEEGLKLSGAEFALSRDGAELERAVSNETGEARFTTPLKVGDTYLVTETKSPQGYEMDPAGQSFTVQSSAEQIRLTFRNKRIVGALLVTKQDAAGKVLSGAQIAIYANNAEESLIASVITAADGLASFDGLGAGEYFYRELKAPEGYRLDKQKHPFSITQDGQLVSEVLINIRQGSGGTSGGGSDTVYPEPPPVTDVVETQTTVQPAPGGSSQTASGTLSIPIGGSAELDTPPENGEVQVNEDGTWNYTADPGFIGTDTFTVTIRHPDGTLETVVIHVEVAGVRAGGLPSSGGSGLAGAGVFGLILMLCGASLRTTKKKTSTE